MKRFDYGKSIKKLGGLFSCLLGLLLLFAPGTHLYPLAYPFVSLFGMVGHVYLCLALVFAGIYILLLKPLFSIRYYHYIGLNLLLFFLSLLFSLIFNKSTCLDASLSPFFSSLLEDKGSLKSPFNFSSGGGMVGYSIDGLLIRSAGDWLAISLLVVLGLLVIFFLFLNNFTSLIKMARGRKAISKARKEKEEERIELDEGEQEIKVTREEKTPIIPPEEEDNSFFDDKPIENPLSSFVFEPAGDVPLPSRRKSSNSTLPNFSDLGPSEAANPSPNLYAHNSLSTSGLREAVFDSHQDNHNDDIVIEKEEVKPQNPKVEPSVKPIQVEEHLPEMVKEEPKPVEINPSFIEEPARNEENIEVPPKEERVEIKPASELNEVNRAPLNLDSKLITPSTFEEKKEEPAPIAPSFPQTLTPLNNTIQEAKPSFASPSTPIVEPNVTSAPQAPQNELYKKASPRPAYSLPGDDLLVVHENSQNKAEMEEECARNSESINTVFSNLKVGAHVESYTIGPSVTRYDVRCDDNFSVAGLGKYMTDVGIKLGGVSTRFTEMVAGKDTSAIEIANKNTRIVDFKEVLDGMPKGKDKNLYVPFGVNIEGKVVSADLSKFPHMLVAGTTGSGKSIYMHSVIMALIMRNRPEDLKLVMVDPKRVELSKYKDLPHLLCPIIKTASEAKICLKKLCVEMDKRYELFENATVSGIREYNEEFAEPQGLEKMPYVVAFLDEYSDLVDAEKDISSYVLRLAQKARAAGIHLFIATQRPDVKIITGTIKSNLPVRVALAVANSIDSTVILGQGGAEELAGHGDMLVDCSLIAKKEFVRCQCPMVENKEILAVANYIRQQQSVKYDETYLDLTDTESPTNENSGDNGISAEEIKNASQEEKYQLIKADIMTKDYASISFIQRTYGVGFPRAGKIFARLQAEGIVASSSDTPSSSKGCAVLVHSSEKKDQNSEHPGSLSQSSTEFDM